MRLSRKVSFSSGHRYWRSDWSAEQNREVFGPWASPFNHGHNYVLWMSVEGTVNQTNGMVLNIKTVDDLLQAEVVSRFDQRSINDEVAEFAQTPPTLENLLGYFHSKLQDRFQEATLCHLKIEETPLLYAEWTPEMITLTRSYEFAASHRLNVAELSHEENLKLFGKCNHPGGHGHNYVLEVTVTGVPDQSTGMICQIRELDTVVDELILQRYDHKNLNEDVPELQRVNTTSEVVAQAIYDQLNGKLPAKLYRIRLFETARNMFEVVAPD